MESKPSRAEAKNATRERVLRTASRAVRRDGIAGMGVAAVMAESGLTHGGFYAHFPSKDALVAAAIDSAFAESRRKLAATVADADPVVALTNWIDFYVTARHRDDRARGCALTALSAEATRSSAVATDALGRGVASLTGSLAGWLAAAGRRDADAIATAMLSEAVGAVTLARVLGPTQASDVLLAATRASLRQRAGIVQ